MRTIRRGAAPGAALLVALLACAHPVAAQSPGAAGIATPISPAPLPITEGASDPRTGPRGSALNLGTLGFPIGLVGEAPGGTPRAYTILPSIAVEAIATDNVNGTRQDRRSDVILSVTPSLAVNFDTASVKGVLAYSPRFQYYVSTPDQQRLDHFFNGQALITLVEERLFVDVRGTSSVRSLSGGFATGSNTVVDRDNRLQTTTFQITPFTQFRFPNIGVAQVGYTFQYVEQSAGGNGLGGGSSSSLAGGGTGAGGIGALGFFSAGDFVSHEVFATLRSEEFDRYSFFARISDTEYDGRGVLDGAYRRIAVVENRYAITQNIAALLDLGYEQQHYGGPRPFDVDGPVWAVGAQATGPSGYVIVKYGRRDGFESLRLDASFQVAPRTRLNARYEERLTTTSLLAASRLASSRLDAVGNVVDPVTGIPISPVLTDELLAVQGGLQKTTAASVGLTHIRLRDTYTLSLTREERTPVNAAPGAAVFQQTAQSVGLSWVRELRPDLSGALFVQYGTIESSGRPDTDVYSAGVALTQDFGQGLRGTLQYRITSREEISGGGRALQNLILVGLRKDF